MVILNCHKAPFVHLIIRKHDKDKNFRIFYSNNVSDKYPMLKDKQGYLENVSAAWLSSLLFEKWANATNFQKKTNEYLDAAYADEPYVLYIGNDDFDSGYMRVKYLKTRAYKTLCEDMQKFFATLLTNEKSYSFNESYYRIINDKKVKNIGIGL